MNGIDIASYQSALDLTKVDCDFVIIKATQGHDYYNPFFQKHVSQAIDSNKLFGMYHYIDGSGAEAEADYFTNFIRGYLGAGVPCLDWESIQNVEWRNESYLEQVVRRFIDLTGVPPIIYSSASVFPWDVCERLNCGAWVAQYADNERTGWQKHPWNEHRYSCAIRQYTSRGVIDGYSGELDLDKAYMNPEQWKCYAKPDTLKCDAAPEPTTQKQTGLQSLSTDELAKRTFQGEFGNGDERATALGSRYQEVQGRLNWLIRMAEKTINGDFGNGETRKRNLGEDYELVQWFVNQMN